MSGSFLEATFCAWQPPCGSSVACWGHDVGSRYASFKATHAMRLSPHRRAVAIPELLMCGSHEAKTVKR